MRSVALQIALCAALSPLAPPSRPPPKPPAKCDRAITPIAAPKDRAYAGEIQLKVDASDTSRRVVRVHEP